MRPVKTATNLKKIQMTDLVSQYQRLKEEIDTSISAVLNNASFINGQQVAQFSEELAHYMDVKHVIPCANGTDALQIAFMALDLPKGSEVITPGFSYAAVAEVCHLLGLKPVFADVDLNTFNILPKEIERLITDKTSAIVPVHLFGQAADMDAITQIAKKHKLKLIEDNAQSIGAFCQVNGQKKMTGTIGDIGTLSFFPSKNLGCYGDGGALCTNDDLLADKIRMIANHGQKRKYHHEIIGVNSRLDTIQAAVLSVKLKHLNSFIEERRNVANQYSSALNQVDGISIPTPALHSTHVYHQYTLLLDEDINRELVMSKLKSEGIPSMVYYPMPIYKQEAYKQHIRIKNSEELCSRVLSLPMGTDMDQEQIEHIITTLIETIRHK